MTLRTPPRRTPACTSLGFGRSLGRICTHWQQAVATASRPLTSCARVASRQPRPRICWSAVHHARPSPSRASGWSGSATVSILQQACCRRTRHCSPRHGQGSSYWRTSMRSLSTTRQAGPLSSVYRLRSPQRGTASAGACSTLQTTAFRRPGHVCSWWAAEEASRCQNCPKQHITDTGNDARPAVGRCRTSPLVKHWTDSSPIRSLRKSCEADGDIFSPRFHQATTTCTTPPSEDTLSLFSSGAPGTGRSCSSWTPIGPHLRSKPSLDRTWVRSTGTTADCGWQNSAVYSPSPTTTTSSVSGRPYNLRSATPYPLS